MKYKKGLIFICLVICLFSIASVCASDVNETVAASDGQNDKSIGTECQEPIASNGDNIVNLGEISISQQDETLEIDVLENAVSFDKNTININTSVVAKDWSYNNYYFDYNDNYVTSYAKGYYSFNLNLTPNTEYDYEFLGKDYVAGSNYYRPWESVSGYQSSVMFKGTFVTDDNGYICNLTHNQHYKFIFKTNGQINFYSDNVKNYALNNKWTFGQEGSLVNGENLITLSVLSMQYDINVFKHYKLWVDPVYKSVVVKEPIYKYKNKIKWLKSWSGKVKIVGKKDLKLLKKMIKGKYANPYKFWFIEKKSNGKISNNYKYKLKINKLKKKVFDVRDSKKVNVYKIKFVEYEKNIDKVKYIAGYNYHSKQVKVSEGYWKTI